jgi:hypothetical protein
MDVVDKINGWMGTGMGATSNREIWAYGRLLYKVMRYK